MKKIRRSGGSVSILKIASVLAGATVLYLVLTEGRILDPIAQWVFNPSQGVETSAGKKQWGDYLDLGGSGAAPPGYNSGSGNVIGNTGDTSGGNDNGSSGEIKLEDLLNRQGNNAGNASNEEGIATSSVGGAGTRANLNANKGTQAGFLSKEVVSYSAYGYGGMKASMTQPSSTLNYFYLILKDSNGKLVRSSPYEHSAKYTLMQMSHDDTVFFTWDNSLLQPGKYTAIIAKGPPFLFNYPNFQILEQRQFDVRPYDFGANNAQNTSSDGYSIHAANGSLTVLAPADKRFGMELINVKIYDESGNIIWKEDTLITDKYQLDFQRNKLRKQPYRAEAVVTYTVWDNTHHRDVEKKGILAAQFSGKK